MIYCVSTTAAEKGTSDGDKGTGEDKGSPTQETVSGTSSPGLESNYSLNN